MRFALMFLLFSLQAKASLFINEEPIINKKICFVGDTGTGKHWQYEVALALEKEHCDQIRILGDIIYENGIKSPNDLQVQKKFFDPYEVLIFGQKVPFFLTLGNHDYRGSRSSWVKLADEYPQNLFFPNLYYSELWKGVCFLALDTTGYDKFYLIHHWPHLIKQNNWVKKVKKQLKEECKFSVAWAHHPYRSVGKHGNAKFKLKQFLEKNIVGSVDAYIAGHDHNLSYDGQKEATHFFVSGGGGKVRALKGQTKYWAASSLGYLTLVINDQNQGTFTFKEVSGSLDNLLVRSAYSMVVDGQGIR